MAFPGSLENRGQYAQAGMASLAMAACVFLLAAWPRPEEMVLLPPGPPPAAIPQEKAPEMDLVILEPTIDPNLEPVPALVPDTPAPLTPPIPLDRIVVERPAMEPVGVGNGFQVQGPVAGDYRMADLDGMPALLKRGRLVYPAQERVDRIEGSARLKVRIDTTGRVTVLEVLEATRPAFAEAARRAAEESVFEPPQRHGKAVRAIYIWPFTFGLK